jgi:arsenate reductase
MTKGRINVLFVDRDNSTRSVAAEALLTRFGGKRFRSFSCGLHPAAKINPHTLEMMTAQGLAVENLTTRGMSEFSPGSAREMDFVINLCDEPLPSIARQPLHCALGYNRSVVRRVRRGARRDCF